MKTKTVNVLLAALLMAGLAGCGDAGKSAPKASEATAATEKQTEEKPVDVTPAQLAKAYEENTVAADDLYKGKKLRITGKIDDIATGITDEPYLVMKGGNPFMGPQLHFEKDARSAVAKLKKGQQVTVLCTGAGDLAKTPMANDCALQ